MGASPPFMYCAERGYNTAFPTTTFDPKAVTRASWEPKPKKTAQSKPLISFNRHPDAHALLLSHQNSHYVPLGGQTKKWIKRLRGVQLLCRILEFNGALGALILLILVTNIDEVTGWIMRILPGVAMIHCLYAIYHLCRKASGRTPGSSSAYHVFAAIFDLVVSSVYAFGAFSAHQESSLWTTRLSDQNLMRYFVPAIYYMIIAVGGVHLISLSISLWLGVMFRRISLMPPDMNPLEDNLTARPFHKRNKSSITTANSIFEKQRHLTSTEQHNALGFELNSVSQAPVVPFLHTREGSGSSGSSVRSSVSFIHLPNRQYQILPGSSPQGSVQAAPSKRYSVPMPPKVGAYSAISTADQNSQLQCPSRDMQQVRPGKFTETWLPTESLVSRTNHRHYMMSKPVVTSRRANHNRKEYDTLAQTLKDESFSGDSDFEREHSLAYDRPQHGVGAHPNPLRSHPTGGPKQKGNAGSFAAAARPANREHYSLSEISGNMRRISNSQDLAQSPSKRHRDSSIQLDDVGGVRKISSGIDYGMGYRRNVSGKVAEEGRGFW